MEVQKGNVVFNFLPTILDNCGFLFSIDGQRTINKSEKVLVAQNTLHMMKKIKQKKKLHLMKNRL